VITPCNTVDSFVAAVTAHSIALPMIQSKYQDLANRSSAPNPRIWILDSPDDEDSKLLQNFGNYQSIWHDISENLNLHSPKSFLYCGLFYSFVWFLKYMALSEMISGKLLTEKDLEGSSHRLIRILDGMRKTT